MKKGVDYKVKYEQLRSKYIQSMDEAFRLGYQQGMERGQVDAAQQQAQQAQEQAQQMQSQLGQAQGQPGQDQGALPPGVGEQPQDGQPQELGPDQVEGAQAATELDAKIDELEQAMIGKSEGAELDLLKSLRKSAATLRKSFDASTIKLGTLASANLSAGDKQTLSRQQQIIDSCLQKWEDESRQATSSIAEVVNQAKRS